MYVKVKCACLKKGISPEVLADHGFTMNEVGNWTRDCVDGYIIYYNDSGRFAGRWINGWHKITGFWRLKKYIQDLIHFNFIDTKIMYEYWVFIGSYRNWSDEKREKIEKKMEEKQKKYDERISKKGKL